MSEADKQWGRRLKQARLAAQLSQKQLGIQAGIDEFVASTRINRYELGVHKPDYLTAQKMASVLGVGFIVQPSPSCHEQDALLERLRHVALDGPVRHAQTRAHLGIGQPLQLRQ